MRVGFGSDIHRLIPLRKLILGGIIIPSDFGEEAHSDGDVLLHALSDAILGALGLEDIGTYFPDNEQKTENMDSSLILKFARDKMMEKGYKIGNVDILITLEKPKLKDYKQSIKLNVANMLKVSEDRVSIKAGTNEGLDDIGRSRAIKVEAIVLLEEK